MVNVGFDSLSLFRCFNYFCSYVWAVVVQPLHSPFKSFKKKTLVLLAANL